jgi:hypothetical protein
MHKREVFPLGVPMADILPTLIPLTIYSVKLSIIYT